MSKRGWTLLIGLLVSAYFYYLGYSVVVAIASIA